MEKKWQIAPPMPAEFKNEFPEIHPVILQLLYNRGLSTQDKIDEFLNPDYGQDQYDPFLFREMQKAVDRIFLALKKEEKILVYGDYDADGITATALLYTVLRDLKAKDLLVYIPYRLSEGYGLNEKAVEEIKKWGVKLIITVDCGIANKNEVSLVKKSGMEIIITDHHHEPLYPPTDAYAIINPKVKGETYPFKDLAGVGVAFKLAKGLIQQAKKYGRDLGPAYEKWLLDLVTIGTVTDCVDVLGENRTIIKYGLVVLNKTRRLGLRKLMEVSKLSAGDLLTWNISFQLGPRLNASGRLNHASASYQLLLSSDEKEAAKLAQDLEKTNQERKSITEKILNEAEKQVAKQRNKKVLFAIGDGWSIGVVGLVAGKLSDEYYKPAIVMGREDFEIVGSGRSIAEFDIISAIEKISQYFSRFGGHAQACGFTLTGEKNLKSFQKEIEKIAADQLKGLDLQPKIHIESEISLEAIDYDLLTELSKFEPFGSGNERPKFLLKDLSVVGIEKVGAKTQHLRLMVSQKENLVRKCIGFSLAETHGKLNVGDTIDLVGEASFNDWNGMKEIQIKICDLKIKT
ncbi:MAG: single-stranded-DNA-specific exonuclease RecJ [Patescibacteria group bacterium]